MCLLIFAYRTDPRYSLVLAANRDEFHARPTAASGFWDDRPDLLAGRDLAQGGTWMGITRSGRFAAITNYRDPARTAPAPRSRGELPLNFLRGNQSPQAFLRAIQSTTADYAGFNLLVGDTESLWYFSNSGTDREETSPCELSAGIYGLSNARLDTPWPKVEIGKRRLRDLLRAQAPSHDGLATVVASRELADPPALHRQGMGTEMDRLLSAQFITTGEYGTRSSTTLWIDAAGVANWREISFDTTGEATERREASFRMERPD